MPASPLAVEAHDLAKTFRSGWLRRRETPALRGASLQVERGAIFGLLALAAPAPAEGPRPPEPKGK